MVGVVRSDYAVSLYILMAERGRGRGRGNKGARVSRQHLHSVFLSLLPAKRDSLLSAPPVRRRVPVWSKVEQKMPASASREPG